VLVGPGRKLLFGFVPEITRPLIVESVKTLPRCTCSILGLRRWHC